VFVGRNEEVQELRTACDRVLNGNGELVLVVGEPGVGKTSLYGKLAQYAAGQSMTVHVGHAYEEGFSSVPYMAFIEALRHHVPRISDDQLRKELGLQAADVGRILPEVCEKLHGAPRPLRDPEEDHWRLLTSVTDFLRAAASLHPMLLVLEDLQWADRGTLDLLVFLSRRLGGTPLLLVCTYRDVEVDRAHPLAGALAELRRGPTLVRILMRGLERGAVRELLASVVGEEVGEQLEEAVHGQTEGNPFFVQEVARYLVEEGLTDRTQDRLHGYAREMLLTRVPEGLRDVIGKRLSRLSAACNQVLSTAAVIGREFGLQVLVDVADLEEDALLEALEQAQHVHVLEDVSVSGEVRFQFTHALFRQTLYEELFTPRRLRLHQRVAGVLEARYGANLEDHAAALSEHFAQSTESADLDKARKYAELAAATATRVSAHADAVRYLRSAVHLIGLVDGQNTSARCDLLLRLGEALVSSGEGEAVLAGAAPEAFQLANEIGDRKRAFSACNLAFRGFSSLRGFSIVDTAEFRTWAEREDRIAEPESRERVGADMAQAMCLWGTGQEAAAHQMVARALLLAGRLGQLQSLSTLIIEPWTTPPRRQRQRFELADELLPGLDEKGPAALRSLATLHLGDVYLTWGDRQKCQILWDKLRVQVKETGVPFVRLVEHRSRLLTHYLNGELDRVLEVGAIIENDREMLGVGAFAGSTAAIYLWRAHLHRGTGEQAVAGLGTALQQLANRGITAFGFTGVLTAQLALCLGHVGRVDQARAILQHFLRDRRIAQPDDETCMPILVALLETAVLLGDVTAARILAESLEVAAELLVVDNTLTVVARHLGAAMSVLDNASRALAYTRLAIDVAERVQFRPEAALARLQESELLSRAPDGS
jgi:hypothetical protein